MASTESRDHDLTGKNRNWSSGSTTDHRSSEEIRRDIERQRNELDVTTEVLQHKLAPRELAEQLWHDVRTRVGGGAGDVVDVVKRHPVPLGLIGAGLAWWIYETSSGHSLSIGHEEDYDSDFDTAYGVGATSTGSYAAGYPAAGSEYDTEYGNEGWRERSRHLAERSTDRLRSGANTAREGFSDAVDRNPLALGAACFSLGILAGIAVPSTRWEHETMGGPARQVSRRAKRAATHAAATAAETAADRAEELRIQAERAAIGHEHHESSRYGQSGSPGAPREPGWSASSSPSSGSYGAATSGSKTGMSGSGGVRSGSTTGIGSTGTSTGATGTGAAKRKPTGDATDGPDPWDPQDPGRQLS